MSGSNGHTARHGADHAGSNEQDGVHAHERRDGLL
jgi:hypothetical protein